MSRLSFRPRPLDIHKKLPIVKSIKDFDDDEVPIAAAATRNSQLLRIAAEADNEVHQITLKKVSAEIPTPQYNVVETYERDYSRNFSQPSSYLRGRGARAELCDFVEYDLDNEDEDWLDDFNNERRILSLEKLESLLFKLDILDHKSRERAGILQPTFTSPVPVLLQLDAAAEALQGQSIRYAVIQSVYNYWKTKRERWQKPILRRFQPPPPVNDTNPYNVFRPREKAHRLHTRRMQRRENNVQSFEKLRQVRRNLGQAKAVLEALIKREETKRELLESEVSLQRIQIKYKNEAQLVDDDMAMHGFQSNFQRFGLSEDDFFGSYDARPHARATANSPFVDSKLIVVSTSHMNRDLKRRTFQHRWSFKRDLHEPLFLFTRPLNPERLAAAGIVPPSPPVENGSLTPPYRFRGRIGRGGRIIFDRWNPLLQTPIVTESIQHVPPNNQPRQPNG
ncbi:hypothetical protein AXF42_Ash013703 [Apostasia shenzhenica]|uniref:Enhancer of polycomb-like protein n=1 Tax=Apostasia shenzhenica TaxID=1088818 RepID=A0A2I0A4L3_9ASPA|nr:hypothetical protein AXF42_Ash013703 [Apostasia shenzhenica]